MVIQIINNQLIFVSTKQTIRKGKYPTAAAFSEP